MLLELEGSADVIAACLGGLTGVGISGRSDLCDPWDPLGSSLTDYHHSGKIIFAIHQLQILYRSKLAEENGSHILELPLVAV